MCLLSQQNNQSCICCGQYDISKSVNGFSTLLHKNIKCSDPSHLSAASVPSCAKLKISMQVLYLIAIPSSSLLFFFRTRAVFHKEPWVVTFFACMWLAVLASCVTPFGNNDAATIGPTKYCVVNVRAKPYTITAAIIPLINDTLVFFAISWQFWCNSSARRTLKDGVRVLIFGDYLPAFSKTMLQDGQAYCL